MRFHKPRPVPLIMSICGVLLMYGLGAWQVQRLIWKEELIERITHAHTQAPLTALPDATEVAAKRFYRVTLTGRFLTERQFHVAARYFQSRLGYHVFTPFKTDMGEHILVNRGWIPADQKSTFEDDVGDVREITAQIRTSTDRNPFTPANQPDRNIWFGRDAVEMGRVAGLDVLPYTLDLVGTQDTTRLPIPSDGEIRPRNDHLGYAITWMSIGTAILIISLLYHRKKPGE